MWCVCGCVGFFKEGVRARIQVGYGSKMCGGMHRAEVWGRRGGVEVEHAGESIQGRVGVRGG